MEYYYTLYYIYLNRLIQNFSFAFHLNTCLKLNLCHSFFFCFFLRILTETLISCFSFIYFFIFSRKKQGKAHGRRSAIYMRSLFQSHLQKLGLYVQKNAGKILFVAIIVLSAFCVGLKSATIHSKVQQLWIQGKLIDDQMSDIWTIRRI